MRHQPFPLLLSYRLVALMVIAGFCPNVLGASHSLKTSGSSRPAQRANVTQQAKVLHQHKDALVENLPQLNPIPMYDAGQKFQVGDLLPFEINLEILEPLDSADLHLQGEKSSPTLHEQGWEIRPMQTKNRSKKGVPTKTNDFGNEPSHQWRFEAIPLKSGNLVLPALLLLDANEKPLARITALSLEVHSAISPQDPHPEQPAYIQPPVGLSIPFWLLLIGVFLAVLLLIGFIYVCVLFLKKHKKRTYPEKILPTLSPLERAIGLLAELEKQNFLELGQYKIYYFKLSEILKAYLGSFYQCDALESTTYELFLLLRARQVEQIQIDFLKSVFSKLDQVKFTDWVPEKEASKELLKEIQNWIEASVKNFINDSEESFRAS